MGYVLHHAIVVTSWDAKKIDEAARRAESFGLQIVGPSSEAINGYRSFLVCPDGSKEGWADSDLGDAKRKVFREWLDDQTYDDGSTCLNWFEVAFGGDDQTAEVLTHAWSNDAREAD